MTKARFSADRDRLPGSLYRNRPSVGSFDGIARLRVGPFARSTTLKLRVTKPGYTTTTISDRIHVHH